MTLDAGYWVSLVKGASWAEAPSLSVVAEVAPNRAMRVASEAAIQAEIA